MKNDNRLRYTFIIVMTAIAILFAVFLVTVLLFRNQPTPSETIVAIIGSVTGTLGTLVGYMAGSSGKDQAEQRAAKAQQQATALLDVGQRRTTSEKGVLEEAAEIFPELFRNFKSREGTSTEGNQKE